MKSEKNDKRFSAESLIMFVVLCVLMLLIKCILPTVICFINSRPFFCHVSRDEFNAVDIYIGMLSIAFIVTSVVTVLSDKSNTIYWTTVVEYQLVNPEHSSLKNIVEYLTVIAFTGLFSLFICPEFILLCLALTILLLFLITHRMIDGFINRENILQELKLEFLFIHLKYHCFSTMDTTKNKEELVGTYNSLIQKYNKDGYFGNDKDLKKWAEQICGLVNLRDDKNLALFPKIVKRIKKDKDFKLLHDYMQGDINNKPFIIENRYMALKNTLVGNLLTHIGEDDLYRVAEDIELLYSANIDWETLVKLIIKEKPYLYYQLSKALPFISFFEKTDECIDEFVTLFVESCEEKNSKYLLELVYSECNDIRSIIPEKNFIVNVMNVIETAGLLSNDKLNEIKSYRDPRLNGIPSCIKQ